MSLTGRDRKILLLVLVLGALAAYWFLLLDPKRDAASKAASELTSQEERRDQAVARLAALEDARDEYDTDYATVVRLGKAIPASIDTPSLMVQLEQAARGSGIEFGKIATGERAQTGATPAGSPAPGSGSTPAPGSTPPATPEGTGGAQPAAAPGGAPAQTGLGRAAEKAGEAVNQTNAASAQRERVAAGAEASGVPPEDLQTSTSSREGGLPVGGGASPEGGGAASAATPVVPGLESVPLDFEFTGNFFGLAGFFHQVKRYVQVANDAIEVQGRLLTIDGMKLTTYETFPQVRAEIAATVYLTPKAQGATAGATPAGPAGPVTDGAVPAAGSAGQDGSVPAAQVQSPGGKP